MANDKDGAREAKSAKGKAKPKAKRKTATTRSETKTTRAGRPAATRFEAAKSDSKSAEGAAERRGTTSRARRSAAAPTGKASSQTAPGAGKAQRTRRADPGRRAKPAARRDTPPEAAAAPTEAAPSQETLTEEERIESAKYLVSSSRPRVFEEERFLFPESYGVDRVRLHVKDPEWLFAHWDVNPESVSGLQAELGDRAMALSRLTLRVSDTKNGGESVILLPPGARSWYVRTAGGRRAYRAELGFTLPSGQFRRLAESNVVVAPRVGPSPERTRERRTYKQARSVSPAAAAAAAAAEQAVSVSGGPPWSVPPEDGASPGESASTTSESAPRPGGASDVFRR